MKKIRKNVLGAALAVLLLLFTIVEVVGIIIKDYNDHQVRETETVQETSIPPSEEPETEAERPSEETAGTPSESDEETESSESEQEEFENPDEDETKIT